MEEELLQTISRRLGVLIALEMKAQSEHLSTTDGVKMLARFGFGNTEIAEILDTSANAVNVMKSRLKKRK